MSKIELTKDIIGCQRISKKNHPKSKCFQDIYSMTLCIIVVHRCKQIDRECAEVKRALEEPTSLPYVTYDFIDNKSGRNQNFPLADTQCRGSHQCLMTSWLQIKSRPSFIYIYGYKSFWPKGTRNWIILHIQTILK